jgi:hypothetical protein
MNRSSQKSAIMSFRRIAFLLFLLVYVGSVAAQTCVFPPGGLISWWPGDDNANDIQGGNHGTLQNGASFDAGMVGAAFSFDGVDDHALVPHSSSLDFAPGSSITMELWAFRESEADFVHMLGKRDGCYSPFEGYQMAIGPGAYASGDVPLNQWVHLAETYDQSTSIGKLYVDGQLIRSDTGTIGANTAPLLIGKSGTCLGWNGLIDEVGIYSRALDQAEIQAIFEAGSAGKCKSGLPNLGLVTVTHEGTGVRLAAPPTDPVMLLGPPSYNGGDPGIAQMYSVNFPIDHVVRFKEWDYKDGNHTKEVVSYLVLGEGVYNMPDGSIWEVGTFTLDGTKIWQSVSFAASFDGRPYLYLTAQTENDVEAASVRARNVTGLGFQAALFEEEDLNDGHAAEEVGYLAIYHPSRSTTPEVNGLGGMVTIDGSDVPYYAQRLSIRHEFVNAVGASLKVEEEKSADNEVQHVFEEIDVLALGGQVFSQQVSSNGGDITALRRNARTKE